MGMIDESELKNLARDIPIKLERILEAKHYSQTGLGQELGVSQRVISNWKRGERRCTLPDVALRIHLLAKSL